jgi:NAD(P)-dependent dehydrogenase (short-subunit alcohol dehydrogenase family)
MRTDMIGELAVRPEFIDRIIRATPLRRIGEAEDVAAAVPFSHWRPRAVSPVRYWQSTAARRSRGA